MNAKEFLEFQGKVQHLAPQLDKIDRRKKALQQAQAAFEQAQDELQLAAEAYNTAVEHFTKYYENVDFPAVAIDRKQS